MLVMLISAHKELEKISPVALSISLFIIGRILDIGSLRSLPDRFPFSEWKRKFVEDFNKFSWLYSNALYVILWSLSRIGLLSKMSLNNWCSQLIFVSPQIIWSNSSVFSEFKNLRWKFRNLSLIKLLFSS